MLAASRASASNVVARPGGRYSVPSVVFNSQSVQQVTLMAAGASRLVVCSALPPATGRKQSPPPAEPKKEAAKVKAQERAAGELQPVPDTSNGKLISKTEVAAFIQRDDMMDQMYRWAVIEAGESGVRNFGLPMNVTPVYRDIQSENPLLWGFKVSIFKEGTKLTDLGIMFDQDQVNKHEWVGRGDDGFPVLEGKVEQVSGKYFEIW